MPCSAFVFDLDSAGQDRESYVRLRLDKTLHADGAVTGRTHFDEITIYRRERNYADPANPKSVLMWQTLANTFLDTGRCRNAYSVPTARAIPDTR